MKYGMVQNGIFYFFATCHDEKNAGDNVGRMIKIATSEASTKRTSARHILTAKEYTHFLKACFLVSDFLIYHRKIL